MMSEVSIVLVTDGRTILLNFNSKLVSPRSVSSSGSRLGGSERGSFRGGVRVVLGVSAEEDVPRGLGFVVVQPEHQFFSRLQALLPQVEQGWWCSPVPGGVLDARPGTGLRRPAPLRSQPRGRLGHVQLRGPRGPQPRRARWPSPGKLRRR